MKHKNLQKLDELLQGSMGYVIFVFFTLLFIAAMLAIIWNGPLELDSQLSIP